MICVLDERDGLLKMLTKVTKDKNCSINLLKKNTQDYRVDYKGLMESIPHTINIGNNGNFDLNNMEITLNEADNPVLPRINNKGNVILELTPEQFFNINDRY